MGLISHAKWRMRRFRSSIGAALAIDEGRGKFFIRELLPEKRTADYFYRGRKVTLTHNTEDVAAFKELFVAGVYDLPPKWPSVKAEKIADLGGNVGMFGLYASMAWENASVIAFEPDPANANKYEKLIADNSLNCTLIRACAGAEDGQVNFAVGKEAHSHISADETGVSLPILDVFPYIQNVDILKMDIEGGEWSILLDPRFKDLSAKILYLEYHRHLCPSPDFYKLAVEAVKEAGYTIHHLFYDEKLGAGVFHAQRL